MKPVIILHDLIAALSNEMQNSPWIKPTFHSELRAEEIWRQKVFCVLSSQFNAAKAANISSRLLQHVPFFEYTLGLHEIEAACLKVLCSPGVGYRFPKIRARQISLCWFPFSQIKDQYHAYLKSFSDEDCARDDVIDIFPGIGMKQASMLMRNIGASQSLAVIDVHILFYLSQCHNWEDGPLTQKRYRTAEEIMRTDAQEYGLELNVFDTVVWTAVRAIKQARVHV